MVTLNISGLAKQGLSHTQVALVMIPVTIVTTVVRLLHLIREDFGIAAMLEDGTAKNAA